MTAQLTWWRRQGALDRPPALETAKNADVMYFESPGPIRQIQRFAIQSKTVIVAFISALIECASPPAIAWFIGSIVIWITINAFTLGAWSHIFKERFKGMQPSFTDLNPASAVMFVVFVLWVIAAFFYVAPYRVFRSLGSSVSSVNIVSMKTAARLRMTGQQIPITDDAFTTANTTTEPVWTKHFSRNFLDRSQSAELLPRMNYTVISHAGHSFQCSVSVRPARLLKQPNGPFHCSKNSAL